MRAVGKTTRGANFSEPRTACERTFVHWQGSAGYKGCSGYGVERCLGDYDGQALLCSHLHGVQPRCKLHLKELFSCI